MNRSTIRVLAGAALLVLTVAACGGAQSSCGTGGTVPRATTSAPAAHGVTAMRADQATRAALAALTSARSVHVAGTFPANGRSERFDMRFAGNSAASGSFTLNGAVVQTVTWDSAMYLKTDRDGWAAMGNPSDIAGMMTGRWFKVGAAQAPGTTPLSLAFFTAELAARATMARTHADHRDAVGPPGSGHRLLRHPLGLINPALYALSAVHAPGLTDITSGNNSTAFTDANGNLVTVQGYSAGNGYDLATGGIRVHGQ
jgi:hypothetical protein